MTTKQLIKAVAIAAAIVTLACHDKKTEPAAEQRAQPAPPPSSSTSGASGASRELAGLDNRKPVPLIPMMAWHQKQEMMEHLTVIQRITDAMAREDWNEVSSASALIEGSPEEEQMCRHMGAGAEGFTELALDFHRRAKAIGEAARAKDGAAALRAMSNTLQACTACHAAFRQEVVDEATWEARTGQSHEENGPMHHGGH